MLLIYFAYFALWIALNGRLTPETAVLGVFVSVLLNAFVKRAMKISLGKASFLKYLKLVPDALLYLIMLLTEIFKANMAIIKLVMAQNIDVEPCLVRFDTSLKSNAARVALANSITLTPGTITVSLEGSELLVHALNHEIAEGLQNSIFERILSRMERRFDA